MVLPLSSGTPTTRFAALARYTVVPITACPYCQLMYDDSYSADSRKHNKRHRIYHEVESELGFLPLPYEDRESLKARAYTGMRNNSESTRRVSHALDLFRAHFYRSLETAIVGDYWRQHPSFEEYVAMADYPTAVIPQNIMTHIRSRYGRREGEIPSGKSYWYPPRSDARQRQQ